MSNSEEAERPVRRYDDASGDPRLGDESTRDLNALQEHIGKWWGDGEVFHEIVSEFVHIDLHLIPPGAKRPFHTIITTGMSDRPMRAPENFESCRYAELLLCLPPDWKVQGPGSDAEVWWWPLRHLKQTARFPHIYETWLWHTHTIGKGNELDPVGPGLPFVGFVLANPKLSPVGANSCRVRDDKEVHFFALLPLHEPELRFAWERRSPALLEHMDRAEVTELVQPNRPCVLPPSGGSKQLDRLRRLWPRR